MNCSISWPVVFIDVPFLYVVQIHLLNRLYINIMLPKHLEVLKGFQPVNVVMRDAKFFFQKRTFWLIELSFAILVHNSQFFFAFSFLLFSSLISLLSSLFTCRYSLLSFSSSLSCTIAFSSLSLSGSSAILGGILDIVASWLSPLLKSDNSKSDPSSQAKLNCVIVPLRSYYMWLTFQTTCA